MSCYSGQSLREGMLFMFRKLNNGKGIGRECLFQMQSISDGFTGVTTAGEKRGVPYCWNRGSRGGGLQTQQQAQRKPHLPESWYIEFVLLDWLHPFHPS